MKIKEEYRGFLSLLCAAFIFSFFGVFVRELDKMFGEFAQVGGRLLVAFLVVVALVIYNKISLQVKKKDRFLLMIFAFAFPLSIIFWTYGVVEEKASNVLFALYFGDIITALLIGTMFYKEKINFQKWIGIIMACIGLGFFVYPFDINGLSIGLLFGLFSGIADAVSNSLRKKLGHIKRQSLLFFQYSVGAILMLLLGVLSGQEMIGDFHLSSVAVIVLFGICLVFIGNLTIYGFNHFDVNVGTIILATELMFALVINYIFLHESPTISELAGGIMIFFAANIVNVDLKKLDWVRLPGRK
ncbi:DMT family transporter [Candidatus Dojkabacteria bacterium]|nr:DMT family transporter [Candidatus Dojkabacteria bacterium]